MSGDRPKTKHCPLIGQCVPGICPNIVQKAAAVLLLGLALNGLAHAAVRSLENEEERSVRVLLRQEALGYENGEGVERNPAKAAALYCKAARLGDADAQFNLGWMYANGRGVERSDATAAFFFHAAAEQGLEQAVRMLATVGGPPNYVPDCMIDHAPPQMAELRPKAVPLAARPEVIPPDAPRPSRQPCGRRYERHGHRHSCRTDAGTIHA